MRVKREMEKAVGFFFFFFFTRVTACLNNDMKGPEGKK